jgi:hypothetical protein
VCGYPQLSQDVGPVRVPIVQEMESGDTSHPCSGFRSFMVSQFDAGRARPFGGDVVGGAYIRGGSGHYGVQGVNKRPAKTN